MGGVGRYEGTRGEGGVGTWRVVFFRGGGRGGT